MAKVFGVTGSLFILVTQRLKAFGSMMQFMAQLFAQLRIIFAGLADLVFISVDQYREFTRKTYLGSEVNLGSAPQLVMVGKRLLCEQCAEFVERTPELLLVSILG
jgi:hypothetical protein